MLQQQTIRCKVRPGLFDDEYVVSIEAIRDRARRAIEFVSDRSGVETEAVPVEGRSVDGRVRVWLLGESGEYLHVLVPASGASDSMRVCVPRELAAL